MWNLHKKTAGTVLIISLLCKST